MESGILESWNPRCHYQWEGGGGLEGVIGVFLTQNQRPHVVSYGTLHRQCYK